MKILKSVHLPFHLTLEDHWYLPQLDLDNDSIDVVSYAFCSKCAVRVRGLDSRWLLRETVAPIGRLETD